MSVPAQTRSYSTSDIRRGTVPDEPSMETLLQQAINERNFLRQQNDQLWKIIEKQKTVINNLQKDNQKLVYERDRRYSKLKDPDVQNRPESIQEDPKRMSEVTLVNNENGTVTTLPIQDKGIAESPTAYNSNSIEPVNQLSSQRLGSTSDEGAQASDENVQQRPEPQQPSQLPTEASVQSSEQLLIDEQDNHKSEIEQQDKPQSQNTGDQMDPVTNSLPALPQIDNSQDDKTAIDP
ncbi:2209_t:CDS:1, partial [Paraglomus occultum]